MGQADYLAPGDWNAQCFQCGRKYKASSLRKNWQGYWVCPEHWEPRQPQDFARSVIDYQTPPWVQPQSDAFVHTCFPNGRSAVAGYAVPGCAIPGYIAPGNTIPFFMTG